MSERPTAASLLRHSIKTPLASIKVAAQLLLKHLQHELSEKDLELLDTIIRNSSTLEMRMNRMLEFASMSDDRVSLDLAEAQIESIHSLKVEAIAKEKEVAVDVKAAKIVIHADPDIADLIPKFISNRQKDIVAIETALNQNDFEKIRILGHSMKGAGGGYGFHAVSEIGKNLEDAAKDQSPDRIRKGILELSEYLRNVEVVYDEQ
ncbi:MAG TPA: histidine kinase dimerization/phospho-acceptor domain-containing protein [Acidobacteriota bacterium]|jgi:HPt (histidine-containing phosphotransfer) domain-containing protein|nr:histidine kinase dimerization/phospho-acceptor domain-containing protein [Acidobacteriota bacterium]